MTLALILLATIAAGCGSTDEQKIVVSGSPLAPESEKTVVPTADLPEQKVDDPNRIIARVNDEIISYRSLVAEYGEALKTIGDEQPDVIRAVLDRYCLRIIQFRLVAQAAEKMGFNVKQEDVDRVAKMEDEEAKKRGTTLEKDLEDRGVARWEWEAEQIRRMKIRSFYAVTLGDVKPEDPKYRARADIFVRPAEVRACYDRHPEDFKEEERAWLDAVFVRNAGFEKDDRTGAEARLAAQQAAVSIAARARAGEDFAELSAEVQKEPVEAFKEPLKRGARKGDEVEVFAWSAKVGDISDPIPLKSGFLVLRLARRTENRVVPFEEARERIEESLGAVRRQIGQIQVNLELLDGAVVEPARLKRMLADRLEQDLAAAFAELSR